MRTGRSLTVFRSLRRVYLVLGVCLVPGAGGMSGVSGPRGMSDPGGGGRVWSGGVSAGQVLPPPVNRMTDRCKNITLATSGH